MLGSARFTQLLHILAVSFMALLASLLTIATAVAQTQSQAAGQSITANQSNSDSRMQDGHILQIVRALNQGEIDLSEPAVTVAKNNQVKQYAQQMVDAHGKALQKLDAMSQKSNLTAEPNEISTTLEETVNGVKEKLTKSQGKDFESRYMEMQLSMHQTALGMLDYTLIPRAENDQLRQHLIEMRVDVDKHLSQAREIYRGL